MGRINQIFLIAYQFLSNIKIWSHIKYTESSKSFERKPFRVFLIIKNHCFFKKYPREFTEWSFAGCFYLKSPSKSIVKTCQVNKVMQKFEPYLFWGHIALILQVWPSWIISEKVEDTNQFWLKRNIVVQ